MMTMSPGLSAASSAFRRESILPPVPKGSGIGIASTVRSSHADCVPWASGTSPLHRPHPGRMAGAKLAIAAEICLVDVNMALACTERECSDVYGPASSKLP